MPAPNAHSWNALPARPALSQLRLEAELSPLLTQARHVAAELGADRAQACWTILGWAIEELRRDGMPSHLLSRHIQAIAEDLRREAA